MTRRDWHPWMRSGTPSLRADTSVEAPRGRPVLLEDIRASTGGSLAVNGTVAMHARPPDLARWPRRGIKGWSWEEVFAAYGAMENTPTGGDAWHDRRGPFPIRHLTAKKKMPPSDARLCRAFGGLYLMPREPGDITRGPEAKGAPGLVATSWMKARSFPIGGGGKWTSYTLDPKFGTSLCLGRQSLARFRQRTNNAQSLDLLLRPRAPLLRADSGDLAKAPTRAAGTLPVIVVCAAGSGGRKGL
jgi:GMC oxidoreductase